MDSIKSTMVLERETKNKVRYKATDDTVGVGEIYIMKVALSRPFPAELLLTVEVIVK